MDIFIYTVAVVAVVIAYFCGKSDGCLACKNAETRCKFKHTKIVKR